MKKVTIITIIACCIFLLQPAPKSSAHPDETKKENHKKDLLSIKKMLDDYKQEADSGNLVIIKKLSKARVYIIQTKYFIKQKLK